MPRKPTNEQGSKPTKNKSGINTHQVKPEANAIKPTEQAPRDYS